ncbi:hypothetical protein CBM2592_A90088 [Cupriavidus taiwanensis]|nr:hypothetical protein CBM2592_A90088 [Cupriavidus taiwanensis]SOY90694.1 hypothetical protein CBM2591_A90087 [Cupriavidus taiwanensis]SOZ63500.1 hypothetical protein CBM2617_A70064 [Cupriavidus taiwanensis]SOZ82499.1 hypothetical protein CBM2618_A80064 [Cupriavidus taiwanensis]SOZ84385.1 hypothetical protein CBM2622_A80064 [Cupriavidus taiwanensis]
MRPPRSTEPGANHGQKMRNLRPLEGRVLSHVRSPAARRAAHCHRLLRALDVHRLRHGRRLAHAGAPLPPAPDPQKAGAVMDDLILIWAGLVMLAIIGIPFGGTR